MFFHSSYLKRNKNILGKLNVAYQSCEKELFFQTNIINNNNNNVKRTLWLSSKGIWCKTPLSYFTNASQRPFVDLTKFPFVCDIRE